MSKKRRSFRPSPALVVAFIALFVAMGGVGYSAIKLKAGSVKTKTIKNGAVTTAKLATTAVAPDAAKLGGTAASGIQKFCAPGAIKGSLIIDTTGIPSNGTYQNATGFNCGAPGNTTSSVQIRRTAAGGEYLVRFTPNPSSGSAIASPRSYLTQVNAVATTDPAQAPGETVFQVVTADSAGTPVNTTNGFSLIIF